MTTAGRFCRSAVTAVLAVLFFSYSEAISACDAEWHQNGEMPDWANVSFSESNNPVPKPKRRRQKMANRKKSETRSVNSRPRKSADFEFENSDAEDDGFVREQVD